VLREVGAFENERDLMSSLEELRNMTGTEQVGVGIKKVLLAVGEAKQEEMASGGPGGGSGGMSSRFAEVVAMQMAAGRD
jgi:vesicle-fusing ATPase